MKIKLDENLPCRLVGILNKLGHEVDTVLDEDLQGQDDNKIWKAAQETGRFLITQDLDFSNIKKFIPGTHHGLLLLRLRNPSRNNLIQRVQYLFENEKAEEWRSCFVVVTDHKIRARYPDNKLQ